MSFFSYMPRISAILKTSIIHGFRYVRDRIKGPIDDGPIRLRLFMEDLGGSFLKFGQILALQPDIIPRRYCDALYDLMDRIPAFSYERVHQTILEELGRTPQDIFENFREKSLATASIGQVHVAFLNGQKVAVKIQRPNAETETAGDIRIMEATVAIIKAMRLSFFYWMVEPMSEFLSWTMEELDYRNEARYMHQILLNAKGKPAEKVPKVYWEYTTRRVLVVEFLEGVTIVDYMRAKEKDDEEVLGKLQKMGFDEAVFAKNIIGNFLGGSFNYGLFHADLHPANLMILDNNVVGYVDFGITGVLSRYSRESLVMLTLAYTRGDIAQMTEIFLTVSSYGDNADPAALKRALEQNSVNWYGKTEDGVSLKTTITRVMLDMLMVSKSVDIWPERDVIKYIRSAIALDGLIARFSPGFEVGASLEEICDKYLKWGARQQLFSYDRMLDTLLMGGHLAFNAPAKAHALMDASLADHHTQPHRPESKPSRQISSLPVALIILFLSLLLSFGGSSGQQWGINLYSAELLVLGGALVVFFTSFRGALRN